jgi:hypothetical protein
MKSNILLFATSIILLAAMLSGCELVGDIFKAGVWTGIFVVMLLIVGVLYLLGRSKK